MKRILALLLSATLATSSIAADLPDLGDVAASSLSPMAERRIGEQIMSDIRWRDASYLDDAEIEDYVQRLGMRLVAAGPEPEREFEFFVMRDSTLNAFALPGGFIGLHSGLIMAAESESELASVLGHEIAHVTQRHIAQLFGKQGQASMMVLASILLAVLAARSNSQVSEAALAAGQAGAIQQQLGYTRAFEREADRIGLQVMEGAGFDVRGMPSFFERMQRHSRVYENNAPAYLRTHPLTQERIADMGNRVAQMRYRQVLDSPDFAFVRAKLRAGEGLASDAVRDFEASLRTAADDPSLRYGHARALLRAGRLDDAAEAVARLRAGAAEGELSLFVETLAGEIQLARNRPAEAVALLEAAKQRFPDRRPLDYLLIEARLRAGQHAQAASDARAGALRAQRDARYWALAARAEEALGRRTAHHRAQAEVYVLRGSLPAAIDQLELARRAADGDFYELSAVDARLRELKLEEAERRAERR
ncbi:MAG: M48 family metallopeptidase [Rhodocyclaceae bacterium]